MPPLDDLSIRWNDRIIARIDLLGTLWLDDRQSPKALWRGIVEAARTYHALAGEHLEWWSSNPATEVSRLATIELNACADESMSSDAYYLQEGTRNLRESPLELDDDLPDASDTVWPADIAMGSGWPVEASWREVQPWVFHAVLPDEDTARPGFVRFHLPWSPGSAAADGARCRVFFADCLRAIPCLHGTAGLGLQMPLSYRYFSNQLDAAIALYPTLVGHPGLEAYDPAECAAHLRAAMYTVNWLTYVCRDWLVRLGGEEAVRRELAEQPVRVSSIVCGDADGLLFQAASQPGLGSEGGADELSGYRLVARALRALRAEQVPNDCIAPPPDGFADIPTWEAACQRYLCRFDS